MENNENCENGDIEEICATFYNISDENIEPFDLMKVQKGDNLKRLLKERNANLQTYLKTRSDFKFGDIVFVGCSHDNGLFIIDEKDGQLFADKNNRSGVGLPLFPESRLKKLQTQNVRYCKMFEDIKRIQLYDSNMQEFVSASNLFCSGESDDECIEIYCNENIY